jgi:hypothetical protein
MRLIGHALTWLGRAAPAAWMLFYTVDQRLTKMAGEVVYARGADAPSSDPGSMLARYRTLFEHHDPLAPRHLLPQRGSIVDIAEVAGGEVSKLPFVTDFLHPHGLAGHTTMLLRQGGRIVAGIDLWRSQDDPHPGTEGIARLRAGHGLLEHAYGQMHAGAHDGGSDRSAG